MDRDRRTVIVRYTPEGSVERGKDDGKRTCEHCLVGADCTCINNCSIIGRRRAIVVAGTRGWLRSIVGGGGSPSKDDALIATAGAGMACK